MTVQAPAILKRATAPVAAVRTGSHRGMSRRRQVILQLVCLAIAATVLFPIVWIVAMSLDPRNISRPDSLFPPGASLEAYGKVWAKPTLNNISFLRLALNSIVIAVIISLASVSIGSMAAYAFSRLQFRGREFLMIAVLAVLMLPAVATIAPLFVQMNKLVIGTVNLRASLIGVAIAVTASQLPFAIWNIKGYFDTIPRELEEAAAIDGAGRFQTFIQVILPLATPVLAVTAFFGFIAGWTEFYFSSVFLTGNPDLTTLAMALNGMVGQYSASTPWSQFAAFSVLVALPVSVVYLFLQRYIISGLTVGGVKG
jgi:arabinogalactan oligomer/maltooligosaccharide transport system permease protein